LHKPIDSAITSLEIFTERRRQKIESVVEKKHPSHSREEISSNYPQIDGAQLFTKQVERLQHLLDRFSTSKVKIQPNEETIIESEDNHAFTLVSREHSVKPEQVQNYEKALKSYIKRCQNEDGNFKVSLKQIKDENKFFIYEIWETESSYEEHREQEYFKQYLELLKEQLSQPENLTSMRVPSSWF